MSDTVTIKSEMQLKAWSVPKSAIVVIPGHSYSRTEGPPTIPVAQLTPAGLDALAQTWLDQLYASVSRESPFKLVQS